jgi:two-component sensor histidine kinase
MADLRVNEAAASDRLTISCNEHTAVISEMHHRLRNNLQVLISLLSLHAQRTINPEVAGVLREMQNQVRAVAYLHDPLYSMPDFSIVHFGQYLAHLSHELEISYDLGPRVRLQLSLADMALGATDALPLALISNELLSNAFRYAFPDNRSGNIVVALRYATPGVQEDQNQICELTIADDGIGLPRGVDVSAAESIGFYTVRTLTHQLNGQLEVNGSRGTSIRISFPLPEE